MTSSKCSVTEPLAYSISALCEASQVGRTTVYAEIKAGRLLATKVGHRTIILVEDARAWLSSLRASAA
jgi:hypothetical protein